MTLHRLSKLVYKCQLVSLIHLLKVNFTNLNKSNNFTIIFILETAPESYWQIMAEYYRNKLEDVTRENQQVIKEISILFYYYYYYLIFLF